VLEAEAFGIAAPPSDDSHSSSNGKHDEPEKSEDVGIGGLFD